MARSPGGKSSQAVSNSYSNLAKRLDRLERLIELYPANNESQSETSVSSDDDIASAGFCGLPEVPERTFGQEVSLGRADLIRYIDKKWVNGTKLRFFFFTEGPDAGNAENMSMVRDGFEIWEDIGIGITFEEVDDIAEAEVRIGFRRGDGAWSYVGRDVIDIPGQSERTMNFGWDLRQDPRGVDTAVHEIGHTLGFPHEHQNPFSGIVWDEEAVYRFFGGPPNNWPRSRTFHNVLRKLSTRDVEGSDWDPNSVMHYGFPAGLIVEPRKYQSGLTPALGLSKHDKSEVKKFYPKSDAERTARLAAFNSERLNLDALGQKNFVLTPDATRNYTIQSFGESDVLMVLFRVDGEEKRFIAGSDDSGTSENARIDARLEADHEYLLSVRMFVPFGSGDTAVMYW